MASRNVMRIELTAGAKQEVSKLSDSTGMTQVAIMSRLTLWLCRQPEDLQLRILQDLGKNAQADAALRILRDLASGPPLTVETTDSLIV